MKCPDHPRKTVYSNPNTLISVIIEAEKTRQLKLAFYRCPNGHGYHLTKWKNKQ